MSTDKSLSNTSLFDRFLNLISNINMLFTSVALVVLTVIFGWLVFGRYVLNATPTWVEQVSLLLIVYIGFLGASVGIHKKTHLGVSVFREISPKPVQRIFEFLSHIIMTGFGLIMTVYGYKLTLFRWTTEIPLIHVTEGLRAIPIMLSGICIVLFSIGHLIHFFNGTNQEGTHPE
ncbi:MAG: TRAP transporter small permease [Deltaproteobacteria bacterium]|nr:TRAP transporter small permease [Deltaproteobacteria bacterium]